MLSGAGFTFIEHTADSGVEVWAPSLSGIFLQAAEGLYAVITGESPPPYRETTRVVSGSEPATPELEVNLQASDLEGLLVDFLSLLLYHFQVHRHIFRDWEIEVEQSPPRLVCRARGRKPAVEEMAEFTEVKAVTYHQLRVGRDESGWVARVLFDL